MERFFGYRADGRAHVLARVRGLCEAERIVRGKGAAWESMPSLDHLAYRDPDLSWDELTGDEVDDFLAELLPEKQR
jgi:hypothetical protein